MPMHAKPAPIYFAATGSIGKLLSDEIVIVLRIETSASVCGMKRVVEVDAGEDREHVGLQEGDQELEPIERDREYERQGRPEPTDHAERADHGHEARDQ